MAYRKFDTGTWQDPWFERLTFQAKLLFIYLWTNEICNQAGCYQISKRRMAFELGFDPEKELFEISDKVEWFENEQIIWIKNFIKWQCQNPKFFIGALNSIEQLPENIKEKCIEYNFTLFKKYNIDHKKYCMDTISIPYPNSTKTVCLSETEQKQYSTDIKEKSVKEKKPTPKKRKAFSTPTKQEVISYFLDNGFPEQTAIKAFDYYTEGNWKDSRGNPVKNWKQKMRGVWFKDEKPRQLSVTEHNQQVMRAFRNEKN